MRVDSTGQSSFSLSSTLQLSYHHFIMHNNIKFLHFTYPYVLFIFCSSSIMTSGQLVEASQEHYNKYSSCFLPISFVLQAYKLLTLSTEKIISDDIYKSESQIKSLDIHSSRGNTDFRLLQLPVIQVPLYSFLSGCIFFLLIFTQTTRSSLCAHLEPDNLSLLTPSPVYMYNVNIFMCFKNFIYIH